MHSQFVRNMFNQRRWKAKSGGCCELMCLHMVHLGLSPELAPGFAVVYTKLDFAAQRRKMK